MVKIIMGFASSLLKEIRFGERSNSRRKTKVESSTTITPTNYVCRDELNIKKPKIKKQGKFDLEPKYQHPAEDEISHEEQKKKNTSSAFDDNENNGVKVKILMKKKDAARLLLKCRERGVLEFMDIAQELVQFPSTSVRVMSSSTVRGGAILV